MASDQYKSTGDCYDLIRKVLTYLGIKIVCIRSHFSCHELCDWLKYHITNDRSDSPELALNWVFIFKSANVMYYRQLVCPRHRYDYIVLESYHGLGFCSQANLTDQKFTLQWLEKMVRKKNMVHQFSSGWLLSTVYHSVLSFHPSVITGNSTWFGLNPSYSTNSPDCGQ